MAEVNGSENVARYVEAFDVFEKPISPEVLRKVLKVFRHIWMNFEKDEKNDVILPEGQVLIFDLGDYKVEYKPDGTSDWGGEFVIHDQDKEYNGSNVPASVMVNVLRCFYKDDDLLAPSGQFWVFNDGNVVRDVSSGYTGPVAEKHEITDATKRKVLGGYAVPFIERMKNIRSVDDIISLSRDLQVLRDRLFTDMYRMGLTDQDVGYLVRLIGSKIALLVSKRLSGQLRGKPDNDFLTTVRRDENRKRISGILKFVFSQADDVIGLKERLDGVISDQSAEMQRLESCIDGERIANREQASRLVREIGDAHSASVSWRRRTYVIAIGAVLGAIGVGAWFGHSLDKKTDSVVATAPCASPPDTDRRVGYMELPSGISDMGVILYTAVPVEDENGFRLSTIVDNRALSKVFFRGEFLLNGLDENVEYGGVKQRVYRFILPSPFTGESVVGMSVDALKSVTLSDALNTLMNVPQMSDDDVKKFLVWWYGNTFKDDRGKKIELDPAFIKIVRKTDKSIEAVKYTGSNAHFNVRFNEVVSRTDVPGTSTEAKVGKHETPRPLTSTNGSLLLWPSRGQELRVPESILVQNGVVDMDLPGGFGHIRFTYAEFAASIRRYFDIRKTTSLDEPTDDIQYVVTDDTIIGRVVAEVTKGKKNNVEKMERLRLFAQQIEYELEFTDDKTSGINRPPAANLVQGWGNCNTRTILMASLFATAGYKTGLVYIKHDPAQIDKVDIKWRYSAHEMVAVGVSEFPKGYHLDQTWGHAPDHNEWALVETGSGWSFGTLLNPDPKKPVYKLEWIKPIPLNVTNPSVGPVVKP